MPLDDGGIVALFLARDEAAIGACAEKYGAACLRLALRILGSSEDAEECVSDTWRRAWDAITPDASPPPGKLGAYLTAITRNLALDRLRERGADKRGGSEADRCLEELEDSLPSGEPPPEYEILLRDLMSRFVRSLGDEERALFLLRYRDVSTVEEIASRAGKSKSAVKVMLYRTRKKLRDYLRKEGIDV